MNDINEALFKAYDIRGIYSKDLDENTAKIVGRAFGSYIGKGKRIVIGLDVRNSSRTLMDHMLKGMRESGLKIFDIGVVPTPVVYFTIVHYGFDGGAMVTASHNPKEWNGFKLFGTKGAVLGLGSGLEKIRDIARNGSFQIFESPDVEDISQKILSDYESFLLGKVKIGRKLRIGVDPGNGCYSGIASRILSKAGLEVLPINNEPDGNFSSRAPEPKADTITQLMKLVKEHGLDFGVAFDSDGDRAIFVDENGAFIRGDIAFAAFVKSLLSNGEKAVYEVSCSKSVEEEILKKGGIPILSRTGRAFILNTMSKENARLGGEIAGHLYFSEIYNADDALYATLKMAELLSAKNTTLSKLIGEIPKYSTKALEIDVDDKYKYNIIDKLRENLGKKEKNLITIDGVKITLTNGWFLLRASNTSPKIRLVAEASTDEDLDSVVSKAMLEFNLALDEVSK